MKSTTMTQVVSRKVAARLETKMLVREYLKSGGKVTVLPASKRRFKATKR
jgi:hypothetical protein